MDPLVPARTCYEIGCLLLGLEVPPIYRDAESGTIYPVFLRRLRQQLSPVLRQTAYEFSRIQTSATYESYLALGPRRFGRSVADADRELAAIERSFSLLLLVSPMNSREAWLRFRDQGCRRQPEFRYRLLPVDPDMLKRRLFEIDLEPVADPAMAFLLHDKRAELDRLITLITDRGTPGFLYGSMRLYGATDDALVDAAHEILRLTPPRRPHSGDNDKAVDPGVGAPVDHRRVDAATFAAAARAELEHYRRSLPDLAADVQIRPDLTGLMVSRGDLLIGAALSIRPARVEPLLHHEVGTHVLTYYNGRQQPLQQLAAGLAGYDELQEGLAVLSEYLCGGLDRNRMRVLAGRVVAARSVEQGADFIETFRLLHEQHGFSGWSAFDITERVHQSGGFTRDLIYLRGLIRLIEHLRDGGALEPLYVGKIAQRHIEIVHDLRARGFLRPPALLPRVLGKAGAADRLQALRDGMTLTEMIG